MLGATYSEAPRLRGSEAPRLQGSEDSVSHVCCDITRTIGRTPLVGLRRERRVPRGERGSQTPERLADLVFELADLTHLCAFRLDDLF